MAAINRSRIRMVLALTVGGCALASLALLQRNQSSAKDIPIPGGAFEASAVVGVPNSPGVLFVDDDRTREIFWLEFTESGHPKPAVSVQLGADVTDLEGITTDGTWLYAVGSQSKLTGTDGDGLLRFTFDPSSRQIQRLEKIQGLKAFLAGTVEELRGTATVLGDHVLNIESIAWDASGRMLLLGLRAPLKDGMALVVPLKLRDDSGPFDTSNLVVPHGRAIPLALDGAGIRSLEFDPGRQTFMVVSGAHLDEERLAFRLFEWAGPTAPQSLRAVSTFPRGVKPEGIARVTIAGQNRRIVVYDGGTYLLMN